MYVFTLCLSFPIRYQVKRTCHTNPIVTDCLLPCGPALLESLTIASTLLSMTCLRAPVRIQASVGDCFLPTVNLRFSLVGFSISMHFIPCICTFSIGKCQYSHDFMLQLRYCPAACVRSQDLKLIPGVTDNTPGTAQRYRNCKLHYCEYTYSNVVNLWFLLLCTDASRGNPPYDKRSVTQ